MYSIYKRLLNVSLILKVQLSYFILRTLENLFIRTQVSTERSHCRLQVTVAVPCHCGWHRGTTGLFVTPWILPVPFPVVGTSKSSGKLVRWVEVLRSNWSARGREWGCWSPRGRGRGTRRRVKPGMCLAAHECEKQGGKTRNWRQDKTQFEF